MNYLYTLLVLFVGFLLPLQVGINSELAKFINSPVVASLISFVVGTLLLTITVMLFKLPLPSFFQVNSIPVWAWGGGFIGATVVLVSIIAGPKIGAFALVAILLGGQLISSVLIDHFGWLGFPVQKMNIVRLLGIFFLIVGFLLIRRN
jgi:bacterial/archaeal transporter family-2 protein